MRSGLVGHGRNDSVTGSIGGMAAAASPLGSPRESGGPGGSGLGYLERASRKSLGGREVGEEEEEDEEREEGMAKEKGHED